MPRSATQSYQPERGVEIGEQALVRLQRLEAACLQPLSGEIVHQRLRLWRGEHATHLQLELGAELAALRERQQLVIRHRTPEEEREPFGKREVGKRH